MSLETRLLVEGSSLDGPGVHLVRHAESDLDWSAAEFPGQPDECWMQAGSVASLWERGESARLLSRAVDGFASLGVGAWAVQMDRGRAGRQLIGIGRLRLASDADEVVNDQLDLALFGIEGLDDEAKVQVAMRAIGGLAEISRRNGTHVVQSQYGDGLPGYHAAHMLDEVGFRPTRTEQNTDWYLGDPSHRQCELVVLPAGLARTAAERRVGERSLAAWRAFSERTSFEPRA
ncbi:MAG TPA: hypothetical protein VGS28_03220 [Candidatus Saccharimonadales bacterium]|nr:hypothetical protein [Candidatus Saccharimonadales bacterium]